MNIIPEQKGRYFRKSELNYFRDLRDKNYVPGHKDEAEDPYGVRRSEQFDAKLLAEMSSIEGCVSIRICYGSAPETDYAIDLIKGQKYMPRLLLIPIDKDGNELEFEVVAGGCKDAGDLYGGVAGGGPCPPNPNCP